MDDINIIIGLFLLGIILLINVSTVNKLVAFIVLITIYYFILCNNLGEDFTIDNIIKTFRNKNNNHKKIKVI
jgi:hypothetical protein